MLQALWLLLPAFAAVAAELPPRCPPETVKIHIDYANLKLTCTAIEELTLEEISQIPEEYIDELSAEDAKLLKERHARLLEELRCAPRSVKLADMKCVVIDSLTLDEINAVPQPHIDQLSAEDAKLFWDHRAKLLEEYWKDNEAAKKKDAEGMAACMQTQMTTRSVLVLAAGAGTLWTYCPKVPSPPVLISCIFGGVVVGGTIFFEQFFEAEDACRGGR